MDRSAELTAALAAVPPGGTYELRGEWPVEYSIVSPVTIESHGARLYQLTNGRDLTYPYPPRPQDALRTRHILSLLPGANLLGDITLEGTNVNAVYVPGGELEAQHGLVCRGGNLVDGDIKIRNVWGDGLYLKGKDIEATVDIDGTGRQGIAISQGQNVTTRNCRLNRVARSAFDIEPLGREQVYGFTSINDTVDRYGLHFDENGGGTVASRGNGFVDGVTFEGLTCLTKLAVIVGHSPPDGSEMEPMRRKNYRFRGCVGIKPRNISAFNLRNIDGWEVTGCTAPFSSKKPGLQVPFIRADDCTGKTVSGNSFPGYSTELQEI